MTREEIEAMEPGRELDRLIRIHLFGDIDESWVWKEWWGEHWITDNKEVATWFELPKYSTDISAAWEVFMKFDTPSLKKNFDVDDNDYYLCKIGGIIVFGKTAPEAICKASLLAVTDSIYLPGEE